VGDFTESIVEEAALARLESLGYAIKHGCEIAAGEPLGERTDYGEMELLAATGAKNASVQILGQCAKNAYCCFERDIVQGQIRVKPTVSNRKWFDVGC
jgi:hypothetical protein